MSGQRCDESAFTSLVEMQLMRHYSGLKSLPRFIVCILPMVAGGEYMSVSSQRDFELADLAAETRLFVDRSTDRTDWLPSTLEA